MRAIDLRTAQLFAQRFARLGAPLGAGLFAIAFPVALGAAGLVSCADSLHLDPPGTGGGSTGSGKDGGTSCHSNPDCPYPTAVCDTVAHQCVECLTISDCSGKPNTVCSKGECTCPTATDEYCAETEKCVDTKTSPTDCGGCGHACFGACAAGKCADKWEPLPTKGAPAARSHHVAVWTGTQMFVWGGAAGNTFLNTGGLYDPVKRTWTPVSTVNAPSPRADATAVWDDVAKVVVVWGGNGPTGVIGTGGRYDPAKDAWSPTSTNGAPSGRVGHSAVWATSLGAGFGGVTAGMIVWGGTDKNGHVGDGAVYDPAGDSWVGSVDTTGAPSARTSHAAAWDGMRMIVHGGYGFTGGTDNTVLGDAFVYNPSISGAGAWGAITTMDAPASRYQHTAVYDPGTGKTILFGGFNGTSYLGDAALLSNGSWASSSPPTPEPRAGHTAVVVGGRMIVFGGDQGGGTILPSGWSLDPTPNMSPWTSLPTAPSARTHHTAVVSGTTMIVWGGDTLSGPTNSGATYDASP